MARGEKQVEEQVAVVLASLTVAAARTQRHQVELGWAVRRRESAVVQADRTDNGERQVAQAAHRGEGDTARGYAAARRVVEQLLQRRANNGQRHRLLDAAALHRVGQFPHRALQLAQVIDLIASCLHERFERAEQQGRPHFGALRGAHRLVQLLQGVDVTPERTENHGRRALGVSGGQQPVERFAHLRWQCVAQEQPVQPVDQGVAHLRRDIEARTVVRIQGPADAGIAHPVVHLLQRVVVQLEAARDDGSLQQAEHGAGGEA